MFNRILVPIDGSSTSALGLAQAIELARALKTPPHLLLMHVVEPPLPVTEAGFGYEMVELTRALSEQGQALLDRAKAQCSEAGLSVETDRCDAVGRVADMVAKRARDRSCDLIVMGTHGRRGVNRWVMGSDAEIVARHCPVPVMLVREQRPGE
jgi:nucleotide-binding universal stress UspA family protein